MTRLLLALLMVGTLTPDPLSSPVAAGAFNSGTSFRCDFPEADSRHATATRTTRVINEYVNNLFVDEINYEKGTARMFLAGPIPAVVFDGPDTVTFVRRDAARGTSMLTIFKNIATQNTYRAAFSSHWAFSSHDEAHLSQFYGTCQAF